MKRGIVIVLVVFCIVAIAVWSDLNGKLAPAAPTNWALVHAGMKRTEVINLIGPPQMSGWPEKIVETWQRNGLLAHRRLLAAYMSNQDHDQIQFLSEGVWVRGHGWSPTRTESANEAKH